MSLAKQHKMSSDEFLTWSETRPAGERYELVNGKPVAMCPEKNRHNLVKIDCLIAIKQAIGINSGCTVLGDGVSIQIDDDTVYEPDVTVQCGEAVDLDETVARHPTIVVEVLSPSTKSIDSNQKLSGYFQLPSIAHYLVIDPSKLVIVHYRRAGEKIETTICRNSRLTLDPPGISISVLDVFESVS